MSFNNFFTELTSSASDADYVGVFGTTAQTLSLSADLGSLSGEGGEIVKWVRYKMGEPKITSTLSNLQIFSMFEEANMKYSAIINQTQGKNWLSNLLGLDRNFSTADYTNKLPYQTIDYLKRLTEFYGTEVQAGGVQNVRRAYVTINSSNHDYSLLNDFVDNSSGSSLSAYISSVSASKVEVRKLWHSQPTSIYRYYDPYSSTNTLSQEFDYESFNMETSFYIFPLWADVLRANMLESSDTVRRSNYTYQIVGDRVRILPKPGSSLKIWMEYTVAMDPFNPDFKVADIGDPSITGISNISQIPYKNITYNEINSAGRMWIREYTFALCAEIEGKIRRKFSSIPIPNGETTLDGDVMVSEAIEMKRELIENLKEDLQTTSNLEMMRSDAETAQFIQEQLAFVPLPSPILVL